MSVTLRAKLDSFKGSRIRHQHVDDKKVFYSDGVRYLADTTASYWLIDDIVAFQQYSYIRKVKKQKWIFTINEVTRAGKLECYNDANVLVSKTFAMTAYPLKGAILICEDGNIMLPTEY